VRERKEKRRKDGIFLKLWPSAFSFSVRTKRPAARRGKKEKEKTRGKKKKGPIWLPSLSTALRSFGRCETNSLGGGGGGEKERKGGKRKSANFLLYLLPNCSSAHQGTRKKKIRRKGKKREKPDWKFNFSIVQLRSTAGTGCKALTEGETEEKRERGMGASPTVSRAR